MAHAEVKRRLVIYVSSDRGFGHRLKQWFDTQLDETSVIVHSNVEEAVKSIDGLNPDGIIVSDKGCSDIVSGVDLLKGNVGSDTPIVAFGRNLSDSVASEISTMGVEYVHQGVGDDQFVTLADELGLLRESGLQGVTGDSTSDGKSGVEIPRSLPVISVEGGRVVSVNDNVKSLLSVFDESQVVGKRVSELFEAVSFSDIVRIAEGEFNDIDSLETSIRIGGDVVESVRLFPIERSNSFEIICIQNESEVKYRGIVEELSQAYRQMCRTNSIETAASILRETGEKVTDENKRVGVWLYDRRNDVLTPSHINEDVRSLVINETDYETIHPAGEDSFLMQAFESEKIRSTEDYQSVEDKSHDVDIGSLTVCPIGRYGVLCICSKAQLSSDKDSLITAQMVSQVGEGVFDRISHRNESLRYQQRMQSYENKLNKLNRIVSGEDRSLTDIVPLEKLTEAEEQAVKKAERGLSAVKTLSENGVRNKTHTEPIELDVLVRDVWDSVSSGKGSIVCNDLGVIEANRAHIRELVRHVFSQIIENPHTKSVEVSRDCDVISVRSVSNDVLWTEDGMTDGVIDELLMTKKVVNTVSDEYGWEADFERTDGEVREVRFVKETSPVERIQS